MGKLKDRNFEANEKVIKQGQKKVLKLQKANYLHNWLSYYEEESEAFTPFDISKMDEIYVRLIDLQREEEDYIYKILNVSGIDELNDMYIKAGGNSDFLTTTVPELLQRSLKEAFENNNARASARNKTIFEKSVEKTVNKMIEEDYSESNKAIIKALQNGIGEITAKKLIQQLYKQKGSAKLMSNYVNEVSDQMASQWRGDILEQETAIIFAKVLKQTGQMKSKVKVTGEVKRNGKSIKADDTVILNNKFKFGISAKNYTLQKGRRSLSIALHSPSTLDNFYKLIDEMTLQGTDTEDLKYMREVANKFNSPYFKYHLINQACLSATQKISQTDTGKNLLTFIKKCFPLFMGSQLKINGDEINVDFFNINGTLIPASEIMELGMQKVGQRGANVHLKSNYQFPQGKAYIQKLESTKQTNNYYKTAEIEVGSFYGETFYKQIKIDSVHLSIALNKLRGR